MELLAILATYYTTLVLVDTDGPWGMFYRLRRQAYLNALHCFVCTSIYIGALFALVTSHSALEWLVMAIGYAGAATIIYKLGHERQ